MNMRKTVFAVIAALAMTAVFAQGKGSIAVPAPKGVNLGADTDWIPLFIQGVITANFQQYSGLTVIDRQNADMVKAEQRLSESAEFDEKNAIELGKMTSARYIVTGNIVAKSSAYALTFSITDAQTGETKSTASVPNCLRSALEDGTAANQISYDLMTGYGIALDAAAKTKLTQKASVMTAETSAQVSVAKGIAAEQSGSNIEALTYYIQARKSDKNFAEVTNRIASMTTAINGGNFGANAKNLIKLRDDWDKLLKEAAGLIAAYSPEFELYYFTDIEAKELTAADYENGTMSFTVSMPYMAEKNSAENEKAASENEKIIKELQTALRGISQSKNWGDKINGFPWTYADDIPGDNWLKTVRKGKETYSFSVSLLNDKKKIVARENIAFTVTVTKKFSGFNIANNNRVRLLNNLYDAPSLTFSKVAVNDADTNRLYITVENTGSKKVSALPTDALPMEKAITAIKSGKHDGTVKIGGRLRQYPLKDISDALKSSKKPVAIDLTRLIGVTKIEKDAFANCTSLISITIPTGVTKIGRSAFANCTSLTSVTIPDSVTEIENFQFLNCNNVIVRYTGILAQWCQINSDNFFNVKTITLSDVADLLEMTELIIPNSVTKIGPSAFIGFDKLKSVIIPSSVKEIGEMAFFHCDSLETVRISHGVTTIRRSAFACSRSLKSITIPSSVKVIEFNAFGDCKSLKTVYYEGSEAQWNAIEIKNENKRLLRAKIHYDYKGC